jgi:hypothetical protein
MVTSEESMYWQINATVAFQQVAFEHGAFEQARAESVLAVSSLKIHFLLSFC